MRRATPSSLPSSRNLGFWPEQSQRYVSLINDAGEDDNLNRVTQIGIWTLATKGGVITIKEGTRKHIGSVTGNQGRWRMLAAEQDQADLI